MKTLSISLIGILFCFLGANAQPPKKLVVTTASIFADMAENIAGGHLEVKTIVPTGGDPHTYEPTPADARLVASADIILKNGLTFEGWLDGLIASANTEAKVVTITEGIDAIHAQHKNSSDPHAWMSAANGIIYIENIKNALVEFDPANKEVYEFNYGVYRKLLEELDTYIAEQIKKIPEKRRILITSHDAFEYYGRRYGLRLESVLGISTDAEAQTSDMVRLAKVIRDNGVPAVFIETTVNPKLLQQIATDNNARIGGKLFSDSIGDKNSDAPSYYQMLKYNTDTIVKALSAAEQSATPVDGKKQGTTGWITWVVLGILLVGGFFFVINKMNA
jgi:ABC-type Zn uptake system ZnuABC Zn-binding protein ZnuA